MDSSEFLQKGPESNAEWLAQTIVNEFNLQQRTEIEGVFDKIEQVMFKGWSNEMTFRELKEAIDISKEL